MIVKSIHIVYIVQYVVKKIGICYASCILSMIIVLITPRSSYMVVCHCFEPHMALIDVYYFFYYEGSFRLAARGAVKSSG